MNEEELEEELKNLDIKEDLGEESDITPINSPIPVNPFAKKYLQQHSSNTSGFFDGDFTRFSSYEDSAMRSGSSLSWGEDEFEGEATRIVNSLFDQLDQLIYKDASEKAVKFPFIKISKNSIRSVENINEKKRGEKRDSTPEVVSVSDPFASGEFSEDDSLDSGRLNTSNVPPPPSSSLIAECKDWVDNFPHLRVIGVGINLARYEQIESRLLYPDQIKSDEKEKSVAEEILAVNGDYENKMQFRILKPEVNKEKKKEKQKVPSRICSGSSDPEVLKEQVLIHVFEDTWPRICQIIEPLFSNYAEWFETQAAQFSMSKDAPNSENELPNIPQIEPRREDISSRSYSLPSVMRSPLVRPSSALYKFPDRVKVPIKHAPIEDLNHFISFYSNPILLSDEKPPSRSLSASKTRELPPFRSSTSMTSLPHLVCPSRPVSSMSGNRHLLTPMPTVEHRPQSTSSSVRLRNKDKFKFDQSSTIVEDKGAASDEFDTSSPPWSRHTPFLPRIESKVIQNRVQAQSKNQPSPSSSSSTASLSYGKSLSAVARTSKIWHEKTSKDLALNAEPFVSWIVSKVERQAEKATKSPSTEKSNSLPIGESKYYRKLSHH